MWPTGYLPSWSAPTGGTDKTGMPTEKHRLAEDPPLEMLTSETRRLGPPSSPLAVDFNTLSATMRPQHHDVCPLRYALTSYGSL